MNHAPPPFDTLPRAPACHERAPHGNQKGCEKFFMKKAAARLLELMANGSIGVAMTGADPAQGRSPTR